jgi:hypothetical protein
MIIQLFNVSGDPVGLYMTEREPATIVCAEIEKAFEDSKDEEDPQEAADEILEKNGIVRVLAEEAWTTVI